MTRFLALFFVFMSQLAFADAIERPKKLFLSIGIGTYADGRWPRLNFSSKDAVDLAAALKPSFDGGQVLSDKGRQGGVTKADIWLALSQLESQNRSEDDTIIVYVSTHGTLAQSQNEVSKNIQKYLVASDTVYDRVAESGISVRELIERFQGLRSRRKALILDSCYSGQGKAHLSPAMLRFIARQKSGSLQQPIDPVDESTGVYTASAWGEEAQEDPQLQNGVYTHFLIKALDSDLNADGATQISEAHQAASNAVIEYTRNAQHPTAQVQIVGRDPVVLRGELSKAARPSLLTWRWDMRQYLVKFRGELLGNLGKGLVTAPEGEGILQLVDPKTQRVIVSRRVQLASNESYSLENFLYETNVRLLRSGYLMTQFLDAKARERISEKPLNWYRVGFTYEDAWEWADLGLDLGMLKEQNGKVKVDQTLLGQSRPDVTEEQALNGWKVDLKAQRRYRIAALTSYDRQWVSSFAFALGASYLQLERELTSLSQASEAKASGSSAGIFAESGLELRLSKSDIWSELKGQYALYDNEFSKEPGQISLAGLSLSLGFYW